MKNVRHLYYLFIGIFINLVESFKERNEHMQKKKHEIELNKLIKSEIRHSRNVMNEKEKFEQRANDNQEKLMKKYITFYWNRRSLEKKQKDKYLHFNEKYDEKLGRLEEIERNTEKKRKNLLKKLKIIETNQNQIKERDRQKYESIREKREKYINTCNENKKSLQKMLFEEKDDILEYQTIMITRKSEMDKKYKLKRDNFTEKTMYSQLTFEKNLKPFYKKLEEIKSDSIIKKSCDQRRRIYRGIKRAEAEAKRKEEEERLLNQKIM